MSEVSEIKLLTLQIRLFSRQLLGMSSVPGTVLDTGGTVVKKTDEVPAFMELQV